MEQPGLYAEWYLLKLEESKMWGWKRERNKRSKTFEIKFKLEIGRCIALKIYGAKLKAVILFVTRTFVHKRRKIEPTGGHQAGHCHASSLILSSLLCHLKSEPNYRLQSWTDLLLSHDLSRPLAPIPNAPWFSSETLALYKSLTYLLTYLLT